MMFRFLCFEWGMLVPRIFGVALVLKAEISFLSEY